MSNPEFIEEVIHTEYPDCADEVLSLPLIQYLHHKTRSVAKGSKSRGSFGNLYAIYVLVEDYLNYSQGDLSYADYEGMQFSVAMKRQRELPFGEKLQNHALNHRCNEEFLRYFPNHAEGTPIIRDKVSSRYWFNERLLQIECAGTDITIANLVIKIINRYVDLKREGFETFFQSLENNAYNSNTDTLTSIIRQQLQPDVDARIFEIVSYAILKYFYSDTTVYFGLQKDQVTEVKLRLYKTGRTNSNDGGIDFIMQPTGKIFQVTEVLDFRKYFLDIEKINHYPITFVIKTEQHPEIVRQLIEVNAMRIYSDKTVLKRYIDAFESIVTIPTLEEYLEQVIKKGLVQQLVDEIILQCKIEFNIPID